MMTEKLNSCSSLELAWRAIKDYSFSSPTSQKAGHKQEKCQRNNEFLL